MTTSTDPTIAPSAVPLVDLDKNLDAACASVDAQIARCDTKASLLLAFTGATLAGLATLAGKPLPGTAQAIGGGAVLALAAAAVLLLLVVRPNLGGRGRVVQEGFPLWARLTEGAVLASLREDTRATRIRALSGLAVAKYVRLRRAVDCILTALALLAAAAVAAVLG
ncbi:Pycsar system effector family protein [Streptomyces sp. NPDC002640]